MEGNQASTQNVERWGLLNGGEDYVLYFHCLFHNDHLIICHYVIMIIQMFNTTPEREAKYLQ